MQLQELYAIDVSERESELQQWSEKRASNRQKALLFGSGGPVQEQQLKLEEVSLLKKLTSSKVL